MTSLHEDSIQLITKNYGKLTKNEQILADYILTHFDDVIHMSVQELASRSGVSAATPVRLAQHMGFDGYKEFRIYLAAHQPEHEKLIFESEHPSDSVTDAVEKALISESDSIRLTLKEIDYSKLTLISEKIKSASQLLFFGLGTSYLVCEDAKYKFQRAGKVIRCTDDIYEAAAMLSSFDGTSIVIGISHSGETQSTCEVLRLARERGICTVAATTFPGSTICDIADHVLYTQTRESPLHKIALTSRISQLATMDALFMAYFTLDYETCRRNMDSVSGNIRTIRQK